MDAWNRGCFSLDFDCPPCANLTLNKKILLSIDKLVFKFIYNQLELLFNNDLLNAVADFFAFFEGLVNNPC